MYTRSYTTERDGRKFVVYVLPDQEIPKPSSVVRKRRDRKKRKSKGNAQALRAAITRSRALDREYEERCERD